MQETGVHNGAFGADKFGLKKLKGVNWNFGAPQLTEHAVRNGEAVLSSDGSLCADTGDFTGRSPKDKFTVRDATTDKNMWWAGNQSITSEQFETLYKDFLSHADGKRPGGPRGRLSGQTLSAMLVWSASQSDRV